MRAAVVVALLAGALQAALRSGPAIDELRPIDALSAQLLNTLDDPMAVVSLSRRRHLVLDARAHGVFLLESGARELRRLLPIGYEPGHLLMPSGLALSRDEIFAVLDAPNGLQRIQYFDVDGTRIGGFFLPTPAAPTPRITGDRSISNTGVLAFTGKTFLVSEPAWGSLMLELDVTGKVLRHVGQLRQTGHETDTDVHRALNIGFPVVDPTGGLYFVFQTGTPLFRKYDGTGRLLYERHIEGAELDGLVLALPNRWPGRPGVSPLPPSLVRTAAADSRGRLWVSLRAPVTYVYDSTGEKVRTVRFQGAGVVSPQHFFFGRADALTVMPGGYIFDGRF
jgi:hypothetical protein